MSEYNYYASLPEGLVPDSVLSVVHQHLLEELQINRRGVIHLGGHEGEELAEYRALGFRRIVAVEPLDSAYTILHERVSEFDLFPRIRVMRQESSP